MSTNVSMGREDITIINIYRHDNNFFFGSFSDPLFLEANKKPCVAIIKLSIFMLGNDSICL